MNSQRKTWVLAIVVLATVAAIAVFALLRTVGGSKSRMETIHEATRPTSAAYQTPYTFQYAKDDRATIKTDSARCKKCHGNMLDVRDGKPKYPIHSAMLRAPLLSLHCTDCHKTVDLGKRTPKHATIRIDRTQCTRCHEMEKSLQAKGQMLPSFLFGNHGTDKKSGKRWIRRHGEVAKAMGSDTCRAKCHMPKSELDFCDDCHRGGAP